ncbi:MAG: TonB-dependent receptor [Bacteroidales bacterium]|nr:TonB-dependent receptor [Bacteroidales bacterium]
MTKKQKASVFLRSVLKTPGSALKLMAILPMVWILLMSTAYAGSVPSDDPQRISVAGRVTDNTGAGLPGVNVIEKGTTNGTITNIDGGYSLTVSSAASVISFSFVGYTSQEITVGSMTSINVVLAETVSSLDEIVVVGYTTQVRKNLSGSISTVQDDALQAAVPAPSVMSRLQGQASGVTVSSANRPGGDAIIRIRGIGTINDSEPLYVIDGVPTSTGNNISANDIESISILKDAASAAIYGARGANGVIIITTKRGRAGQAANIDFNFRSGVHMSANQYDLLNPTEYMEAVWLSFKNRGVPPQHQQYGNGSTPVMPDYILPAGKMEGDPQVDPSRYSYPDETIYKANKEGTNWYDEIYRKGISQEYDLSVRGGGNRSSYAFSGNYLNENGLLIHTNFKRYTFRVNSDVQVNNWFKAGQSLQAIYINEHGNLSQSGEGTPISNAYRTQSIIPVYDIAGNFAGSRAPEMGNGSNPVAGLYRARNNQGQWARALGNFYGEFTILKGLTAKSLFGYNFGQWNYKGYTIPDFEFSEPNKVNGHNISSSFGLQWNWTNTINYITTIANDHKLNVVLGTEAIESKDEWVNASRSQYFSEDPSYMWLSSGEINKDNSGSGSSWSLFSLFGRVNYDYKGKYLVEGTIRRDGSSRFSAAHRYGVFPAASVGWTLSEESFMQGSQNWLNFLKLRAGWGMSGNDRIGNYNSYSTYGSNKYTASYALDGSNTAAITGFEPSTLGNPDVTWETTTTMNLGVDAMFLNNNMTFAFDIWQRNTSDMLFQQPIPNVVGLARPPFINIAEMINKGFDLELGYRNSAMDGKFRYNLKLTLSHYKNEITKIAPGVSYIAGTSERQVEYTRAYVGTPFPVFYGYEVEGIFQTAEEAAAHQPFGNTGYNVPGHFKFKNQLTIDSDGDGVMDRADNIIDPNDMTFIGNPHPDLTGGLNIDLGYGNFDLNMFFYGSYGNDIINYVSRWIDYGQFNGGLSKDALYKSWGSPHLENNADAKLPMLDQDANSQNSNSAFVEDGSFLRFKTLRLGYTLPRDFVGKAQIRSVNFYVQLTNLFTLTRYSGLDPELYRTGDGMGLDNGSWPTSKQLMFGISLGL